MDVPRKKINLDRYQVILFDADKTLFSFDSFLGLQHVFFKKNKELTRAAFDVYKKINQSLWAEYERHEISAETIKNRRFQLWEKDLGLSSYEINTAFVDAMADVCVPLAGAQKLLEAITGTVKIGIVTNGLAQLQQKRLEITGFSRFIDALIVSETEAKAKPHPDIFKRALEQLGNPRPSAVLMVGDSMASDIKGGVAAKLDTCWVTSPESLSEIEPTYRVTSLDRLHEILFREDSDAAPA